MKLSRLIVSVLAVAAVCLGADFLVGKLFDRLVSTARGGDTAKHHYINCITTDSVLIFGSSRAAHHYDAPLLADSLATTVYNCGIDGQGAILNYMMLNNIIRRGHHPALIIYEITPDFDYLTKRRGADNPDFLAHMRPFYALPGIKEVFADVAPSERLKMMLNTYRYNHRFVQIASDNVRPKQSHQLGYAPLSGQITTEFKNDTLHRDIDTVKIKYLTAFIDLCAEARVPLVLVLSPFYHPVDSRAMLAPVSDMIAAKGVTLLDFYSHPDFLQRDSLFTDPSHLNSTGATHFTRLLIPSIKNYMVKGRVEMQ